MKQLVNDYFSVFSRKKLLTFVNIYKRLQQLGISPEDFITGVMELEDERIEQIHQNEKTRENEKKIVHQAHEMIRSKCPGCNSVLSFRTINIPQGRRNLYGHNVHIFCTQCFYEQYRQL